MDRGTSGGSRVCRESGCSETMPSPTGITLCLRRSPLWASRIGLPHARNPCTTVNSYPANGGNRSAVGSPRMSPGPGCRDSTSVSEAHFPVTNHGLPHARLRNPLTQPSFHYANTPESRGLFRRCEQGQIPTVDSTCRVPFFAEVTTTRSRPRTMDYQLWNTMGQLTLFQIVPPCSTPHTIHWIHYPLSIYRRLPLFHRPDRNGTLWNTMGQFTRKSTAPRPNYPLFTIHYPTTPVPPLR